jgi:hypothetical protein
MIKFIQNYTIEDIKTSIKYLLDKSSQSEEVRQLALSITRNTDDPIVAVHSWIKDNIKYVADPVSDGELELFISPVRIVKDYADGKSLGGDCDDMAILTTALYRSLGIRSDVVLLDVNGKGLDHAVSQVFSDKLGRFIIVDPSSNLPVGWEEKYYEKVVV